MSKNPLLVLIRQGQSQWNKENKFTGWIDIDLSNEGVQECIHAPQYKSDLIRCADANNLPCGTATTGNDTLARGKTIVSKNGDVFIKIKGAGAEKTYRAFWAQLNGGLTAGSPASVSFNFIGSLFTDDDGDASGYFSGALTGVNSSIGYLIIDDGVLNQFASGILTP